MHPVLFQIPTPWGTQYIYSYGVMLGLSLIIGWKIVFHFGMKNETFDKDIITNCFLITAISAIIGSRVLYVLTNIDSFDSPIQWFNLRSGGLVAYGGFLGGTFGAYIYLRIKRNSLAAFADAAAPALAIGLSFTRIGCFLYGCDFGKRLSENAPSWLKVMGSFPRWTEFGDRLNGSPAFIHHVELYYLSTDASHSLPVHPTQLYAVIAGLILFFLTLFIWARRHFPGQVILSLVIGYSIWRFCIEYIRDDPERGTAFGFSTSQLISLLLLPIALTAYIHLKKKYNQAA